MMRRASILLLLGLLLGPGCTHTQLRVDHVNQARTLTTIFEQQVLDNLAMFYSQPEAIPFFSLPGAGSTSVTDSGAISASPLNGPGRTILGPLSLSRDNLLTWASQPIVAPDRLEVMRCAYRKAIGIMDPTTVCPVEPLRLEPCAAKLRQNPCEKVGAYCGTYIRVCPESYRAFSQLVLHILTCAVGRWPPPVDTEVVQEFTYDAEGRVESIKTYEQIREQSLQAVYGSMQGQRPAMLPRTRLLPSLQSPSLFEELQLQLYRGTIFPQFR